MPAGLVAGVAPTVLVDGVLPGDCVDQAPPCAVVVAPGWPAVVPVFWLRTPPVTGCCTLVAPAATTQVPPAGFQAGADGNSLIGVALMPRFVKVSLQAASWRDLLTCTGASATVFGLLK